MGGSSYTRSYFQSSGGQDYSNRSNRHYSGKTNVDPTLLPKGDRRISTDVKYPIVIALDVTGSMGNNTKIIYDKMPVFYGQIVQKNYLTEGEFALSFSAIGDAYTDIAPLQVTPFEQGLEIDKWLEKVWLEGGGGGQSMESYDLCGLFYLTKATIKSRKGFFFFICDEGPYPELDGKDTMEIFMGLKEQFNVYVLHLEYNQGSTDEKRIVSDWRALYGENFRYIKEPKSIIDVMLGIIAMKMGKSLNEYIKDMKERGQTEKRIKNVKAAVNPSKLPVSSTESEVREVTVVDGFFNNRDPFRDRR